MSVAYKYLILYTKLVRLVNTWSGEGVRSGALTFFKSYLTDRKQTVETWNFGPAANYTTYSILGHIVFNDMHQSDWDVSSSSCISTFTTGSPLWFSLFVGICWVRFSICVLQISLPPRDFSAVPSLLFASSRTRFQFRHRKAVCSAISSSPK